MHITFLSVLPQSGEAREQEAAWKPHLLPPSHLLLDVADWVLAESVSELRLGRGQALAAAANNQLSGEWSPDAENESRPLVRLCRSVIPLLGSLGGRRPGTTASEVTLLPDSEVPSRPSAICEGKTEAGAIQSSKVRPAVQLAL